jgi:hypothetical protein
MQGYAEPLRTSSQRLVVACGPLGAGNAITSVWRRASDDYLDVPTIAFGYQGAPQTLGAPNDASAP